MSYIGTPPNQQLRKITSQSFNGDGSTTVFTLNRSVDNGESLEVFVDNVQQEPGTTKSYTAAGTSLTFSEAPQTGTGNIYVIYRGVAEVTTRLEHDPNQALQATTGTFSSALSATTGTFTGNVDINGNELILDADADTKLYASTDDIVKMDIAGSEVFRFDADGLKFNGDTASANAISDYEEGTWTPVYEAATTNPTCTYDKQEGFYTKIGRLVTITCRIRTDSASGGSGGLRIAGLPFTSNSATGSWGAMNVGYTLSFPAGEGISTGYIGSNSTYIIPLKYNSSDPRNARATGLTATDLNTGANSNDLIFTATYYTA